MQVRLEFVPVACTVDYSLEFGVIGKDFDLAVVDDIRDVINVYYEEEWAQNSALGNSTDDFFLLEWEPLITTCWVLSVRKHLIQSSSLSRTPMFESFFNRMPWSTLSKAFLKSS